MTTRHSCDSCDATHEGARLPFGWTVRFPDALDQPRHQCPKCQGIRDCGQPARSPKRRKKIARSSPPSEMSQQAPILDFTDSAPLEAHQTTHRNKD